MDYLFKKIISKSGGDIKHLVRYLIGKRTISYKGLLWEIKPFDNHTDYTMWLKGISGEEEELSHLASLIGGQDINFVDIGANIGLYSVFISSVTSSGSKIYSFEPNPKMRERLNKNIELNKIENIEVFPYAVGAERGELSLNFPSRWNSGQASLVLKPRNQNSSISVEVRPLADLVPKNIKIDLIKIDIEGAEDQALIPYLQCLPNLLLPSHIFLEHVHSDFWEQDLRSFLTEKGYYERYRSVSNTLFSLNEYSE